MLFKQFSQIYKKFAIDRIVLFCYNAAMEKYNYMGRRPIYSEVQRNTSDIPEVATIEASSPWKDADVSFNFVKVDYPKLHTHIHWELLIVLSGTVTHEINGHTYTLKKGDACLIRPQDCHRMFGSMPSESGSYQHLNFLIRSAFLEHHSHLLDPALYESLMASSEPLRFNLEDQILSSVIKRTITIQASDPSSPRPESLRACKLVFQELYLCFLNQYLSPPSAYPEWLLRFLVLLQDVNSFNIPVSQLARTTPYSYSRLIRLFKSYTGVSLVDHITDVKIAYAKSLLKHTNMTMLAVASTLDFSVSYFNKLFKKREGITPGEYRRKHQRSFR